MAKAGTAAASGTSRLTSAIALVVAVAILAVAAWPQTEATAPTAEAPVASLLDGTIHVSLVEVTLTSIEEGASNPSVIAAYEGPYRWDGDTLVTYSLADLSYLRDGDTVLLVHDVQKTSAGVTNLTSRAFAERGSWARVDLPEGIGLFGRGLGDSQGHVGIGSLGIQAPIISWRGSPTVTQFERLVARPEPSADGMGWTTSMRTLPTDVLVLHHGLVPMRSHHAPYYAEHPEELEEFKANELRRLVGNP